MIDCRARALIYSLVALLVFVVLIWRFGKDAVQSLQTDVDGTYKGLYVGPNATDQANIDLLKRVASDTRWVCWSVRMVLLASIAFLIRLYCSMELFDGHQRYFHRYIRPLRYPRIIEWFLRFAVVAYLIIGTEFGFSVVANVFRNHLHSLPAQSHSIENIRSLMFFLMVLYIVLLLWDLSVILPAFTRQKLLRFFLPHAMGFVGCFILTWLFWTEDTIRFQPVPFCLGALLVSMTQMVLVLFSLFFGEPGRWHGFLGDGSILHDLAEHWLYKLSILWPNAACDNPYHEQLNT